MGWRKDGPALAEIEGTRAVQTTYGNAQRPLRVVVKASPYTWELRGIVQGTSDEGDWYDNDQSGYSQWPIGEVLDALARHTVQTLCRRARARLLVGLGGQRGPACDVAVGDLLLRGHDAALVVDRDTSGGHGTWPLMVHLRWTDGETASCDGAAFYPDEEVTYLPRRDELAALEVNPWTPPAYEDDDPDTTALVAQVMPVIDALGASARHEP